MPHIPVQQEANKAAAEFLRKMADLVEQGDAHTVEFQKVSAYTPFNRPAWPVETEYVMCIKVQEVPDGG
jgi:hypothetical protein